MTSLNATQTTRGNRLVEETSQDAGYPQSLMLRMMQNASRSMARSGAPRLDPQFLSENLRRDIGFVDWTNRDRER
jgi:hypothetical protein